MPLPPLVLPPHFLPSVNWFLALARALHLGQTVTVAEAGTYRKQQNLNRARIKGPNQQLWLSVPVQHTGQDTAYRHAAVAYAEPWPREHARSLETAYRKAPFWEHYAPDLLALLATKPALLADCNRGALHWLCRELQLPLPPAAGLLAQAALPAHLPALPAYYQLHGPFVPGLSAVDLLFNEGPRAGLLLRRAAQDGSTLPA